MIRATCLSLSAVLFSACVGHADSAGPPDASPAAGGYFDNRGRDDVLAGGIKRIPIDTPKGRFTVWTKRVGNSPRVKVLLLDQVTYTTGVIQFLRDVDRGSF